LFGGLSPPKPHHGDGTVADPFITDPFITDHVHNRPVAYLGYGRHGTCRGRHFDGPQKLLGN